MARSPRHGSARVLLVLAALAGCAVAAALVAPADARARPVASEQAVAQVHAPVRYAVGLARCTFRDPSRTTYDYATGATLPGRTLVTEIRYPVVATGAREAVGGRRAAPPAYEHGPFPTIFFAPGYDVTPDTYAKLLGAWVRAGFVVVAPSFPDTSPAAVAAARTGDPEDDVANQPGDLAFLVRQVLAATRAPLADCRMLRRLVDPAELGVAGQSDGGSTVAMLAYDRAPAYASLDAGLGVRAAVVMSGSEEGDTGPYEATVGDPALLVVQSSTDQCNPPQESVELYDAIDQSDKWFLDIHRADHLPPYDGADPRAFAVVVGSTVRFFRLELHAEAPAAGFLAYGNRARAVATLTTGSEAPAIPPLPFDVASCYLR